MALETREISVDDALLAVLEIEDGVLKKCKEVGNIEYSISGNDLQDVTSIGDYAFKDCTGITQLTISEGVTIGTRAFEGCAGITQLTISEGVTIGRGAFMDCTGIAKTYVSCRLDKLAKKEIKYISQVCASAEEIGTVVREMPMYQRLVNFGKPVGLAILYHKSYASLKSCFRFLGKREKERIKTLILCLDRLSDKDKMPELPLHDLVPMITKPTRTSIRYYETEKPVKVESDVVLRYSSHI